MAKRSGQSKKLPKRKVGLWMVGACGGIGTTVALGLSGIRRGLVSSRGLVSALPIFSESGLIEPENIILGGHEIRAVTLLKSVQEANHLRQVQQQAIHHDLIAQCEPDLRAIQRDIRPGTLCGVSDAINSLITGHPHRLSEDRTPDQAVQGLAKDILAFKKLRRLDHVVVVNIASTEPPIAASLKNASLAKLLARDRQTQSVELPASCLYALAAIESRSSFIDFTPSTGITLPAIQDRAAAHSVAYMGRDGKTGETLIKSTLAPMFAMRNLRVLSWFGQNLLGNRDGVILNDKRTRASKLQSKDRAIRSILSDDVDTRVSIEYVQSLGDWKTAWDLIHFEGFLGTRMSMQFTWQGCDSILAAPLILDLVRFTDHAVRNGHQGPMTHLACFFKDPFDVKEQDLFSQFQRLVDYVKNSE